MEPVLGTGSVLEEHLSNEEAIKTVTPKTTNGKRLYILPLNFTVSRTVQ